MTSRYLSAILITLLTINLIALVLGGLSTWLSYVIPARLRHLGMPPEFVIIGGFASLLVASEGLCALNYSSHLWLNIYGFACSLCAFALLLGHIPSSFYLGQSSSPKQMPSNLTGVFLQPVNRNISVFPNPTNSSHDSAKLAAVQLNPVPTLNQESPNQPSSPVQPSLVSQSSSQHHQTNYHSTNHNHLPPPASHLVALIVCLVLLSVLILVAAFAFTLAHHLKRRERLANEPPAEIDQELFPVPGGGGLWAVLPSSSSSNLISNQHEPICICFESAHGTTQTRKMTQPNQSAQFLGSLDGSAKDELLVQVRRYLANDQRRLQHYQRKQSEAAPRSVRQDAPSCFRQQPEDGQQIIKTRSGVSLVHQATYGRLHDSSVARKKVASVCGDPGEHSNGRPQIEMQLESSLSAINSNSNNNNNNDDDNFGADVGDDEDDENDDELCHQPLGTSGQVRPRETHRRLPVNSNSLDGLVQRVAAPHGIGTKSRSILSSSIHQNDGVRRLKCRFGLGRGSTRVMADRGRGAHSNQLGADCEQTDTSPSGLVDPGEEDSNDDDDDDDDQDPDEDTTDHENDERPAPSDQSDASNHLQQGRQAYHHRRQRHSLFYHNYPHLLRRPNGLGHHSCRIQQPSRNGCRINQQHQQRNTHPLRTTSATPTRNVQIRQKTIDPKFTSTVGRIGQRRKFVDQLPVPTSSIRGAQSDKHSGFERHQIVNSRSTKTSSRNDWQVGDVEQRYRRDDDNYQPDRFVLARSFLLKTSNGTPRKPFTLAADSSASSSPLSISSAPSSPNRQVSSRRVPAWGSSTTSGANSNNTINNPACSCATLSQRALYRADGQADVHLRDSTDFRWGYAPPKIHLQQPGNLAVCQSVGLQSGTTQQLDASAHMLPLLTPPPPLRLGSPRVATPSRQTASKAASSVMAAMAAATAALFGGVADPNAFSLDHQPSSSDFHHHLDGDLGGTDSGNLDLNGGQDELVMMGQHNHQHELLANHFDSQQSQPNRLTQAHLPPTPRAHTSISPS